MLQQKRHSWVGLRNHDDMLTAHFLSTTMVPGVFAPQTIATRWMGAAATTIN
jgi:hypothetical protein